MPILRTADSKTHQMHGAKFTSLASPTLGTRDTSVWRVLVGPGTPATPHQVTREEILVVMAGRAMVRLGEERSEASAGDVIVVPPSTTFELSVLGEDALEALVCFPVGGQARLLDGTTFTPPWAA